MNKENEEFIFTGDFFGSDVSFLFKNPSYWI